MIVLPYVARAGASVLIRTALIGFGYVLPALSSVKAVVHRDVDAYHLWVTYFLILHLYSYLEPILDLALHPLLRLALIMWLSLPRYQGALWVYDRLILPLADRYERDVDGGIDAAGREVRRRALECAAGAGMGVVGQIVGIVAAARQQQATAAAAASDGGTWDVDGGEEGPGAAAGGGGGAESGRRGGRDPQHSVRGSLSTLGSISGGISEVDFGGDREAKDAYVRDFLTMLSRGLFVFAHTPPADDGGGTDGDSGGRKDFRLRVFSYERDDRCLLISSVGSSSVDDGLALPLRSIYRLEASGPQGLVFLSCGGRALAEIVLSDADDRETLLAGLRVCLPGPGRGGGAGTGTDGGGEECDRGGLSLGLDGASRSFGSFGSLPDAGGRSPGGADFEGGRSSLATSEVDGRGRAEEGDDGDAGTEGGETEPPTDSSGDMNEAHGWDGMLRSMGGAQRDIGKSRGRRY